jgi:uncharacterized membrane protein
MGGPDRRLELGIARLLTIGTFAAVSLLVVGVGLMVVGGQGPLDAAPNLDPGRLLDDVLALRPAGLLWLGLIVLIATPSARVAAALIGYVRDGERGMVVVSCLILIVVSLGVVTGLGSD